ncbi:hypothetical protein [Xanthobacter sp. ZOL 2024]
MITDVKDLVARLRDTDYAGPMQHLRGWSDLDRIHAEAATALEAQAEEIAQLVKERDGRNADAVRRAGEKAVAIVRVEAAERERDALKLNVQQLEEFIGRREDDILSIARERNALRAEVDRLRASLELAANRLDRLALEDMPLKADATDWGISARAALHPTQGGE